eukprot:CAMPEP_0117654780 /NCGR_PEP_ID=MMETSP0804-20121206/3929_1 /TAXON_ID=1074897 /ORGANISM="Tetraselmis astigmatica, Strain CCMP880" /LENGTH=60 /DNA_ID=CAMNT_0005461089 /DNA_START=687 /DNA_END=869 /DNA_ORIENTATION=+
MSEAHPTHESTAKAACITTVKPAESALEMAHSTGRPLDELTVSPDCAAGKGVFASGVLET